LDMLDNLTDVPSETQKLKYKDAILNLIKKGISNKVPNEIYKILDINNEVLQEAPKDKVDAPDSPDEPDKPIGKDSPDTNMKDDSTGNVTPPKGLDTAPHGGEGNDIFKDEPMPDAEMPGESGAGGEEGNDKELSIVKYNEKLKSSKLIDKQKTQSEPGFKFNGDSKFYEENYVAQDPKGSLLIAVPNTVEYSVDKGFIDQIALPKIIKIAYNAIKSGRDVVLLGDYGLPYYNGKYSDNISGIIAKVLREKFKNFIKFDTWNPQDYYSFVSNTSVWKELKSRTEAHNAELKAALYLFLLATNRDSETVKKLKSKNVDSVLLKWGFPDTDLNMQTDKEEINRIVFPDSFGNPETLASYIIKTYLQLLRVNLLKKVIQYEKEDMVCIIPTDANTSWVLNNSFRELDSIQKSKAAEAQKAAKDAKDAKSEKTPKTKPEAKPEAKPEKQIGVPKKTEGPK